MLSPFRVPVLFPLIAFASLVLALCFHTWVDPDIWGHLLRGQMIWETGAFTPNLHFLSSLGQQVNHYWLFQVICFWIHRVAGSLGVTLLFLILWALIFLVVSLPFRPLDDIRAWIFLGIAALICEPRILERPEVFGYLIVASQLRCLLDDKWWALFPLQILLSNLHGYFFLGPALVALRAVLKFFEGETRRESRRLAGIALLLVLVSGLTPFGFAPWTRVLEQGQVLSVIGNRLIETQPLSAATLWQWPNLLFFLSAVGTGMAVLVNVVKTRRLSFPAALSVIGLSLGFYAIRLCPFLVIFAAPFWAEFFESTPQEAFSKRPALSLTTVLLAITCLLVSNQYYRWQRTLKRFGYGESELARPEKLLKYLSTNPPKGPLFNDPTVGSYLKYQLPQLTFYADSVMGGAAEVVRYGDALVDPKRFADVDANYHFEFALLDLSISGKLVGNLIASQQWDLVYADLHFALLHRTPVTFTHLPRIYDHEDLREPYQATGAIGWTVALMELRSSPIFIEFLSQLSAANEIPQPILDGARSLSQSDRNSTLQAVIRGLQARAY
jgi:hypothetical protein